MVAWAQHHVLQTDSQERAELLHLRSASLRLPSLLQPKPQPALLEELTYIPFIESMPSRLAQISGRTAAFSPRQYMEAERRAHDDELRRMHKKLLEAREAVAESNRAHSVERRQWRSERTELNATLEAMKVELHRREQMLQPLTDRVPFAVEAMLEEGAAGALSGCGAGVAAEKFDEDVRTTAEEVAQQLANSVGEGDA